MAHLREAVLHVLSDPTHPDLPANLRLAASAVTDAPVDLRMWLEGGLFTRLLHILRTLPTLHLAPIDAADPCAGAAAVLTNILLFAGHLGVALPSPAHSPQALQSQLRSPDILTALIKHGMLGPAAMQPLTTCAGINMQVGRNCLTMSLAIAGDVVRFSAGFWTPLRVSGFLLQLVLSGEQPEYTPAQKVVLGQLADERVFTHLLQTTSECPVDMPWVLIRQVALCNEAAVVASMGLLLPELRLLVLRKQQEGWESAHPAARAAQAWLAEGGMREMAYFIVGVITSILEVAAGRAGDGRGSC